jgi:hypothetical protein
LSAEAPMTFNVWEKIEAIRRQPEHIRMRYVFGCLVVSMAFIVGIWMLSVRESFHTVAHEIPQTAQQGKTLLPDMPATPSLSDMLKQASPLRVEGKDKTTGQQFFEDQVQAKNDTSQEGIPNTQAR